MVVSQGWNASPILWVGGSVCSLVVEMQIALRVEPVFLCLTFVSVERIVPVGRIKLARLSLKASVLAMNKR